MNDFVDFTEEAIKDLSDIACYTAETWGSKQALDYAESLNKQSKKLLKATTFQRLYFQPIRISAFAVVDNTTYFSCSNQRMSNP